MMIEFNDIYRYARDRNREVSELVCQRLVLHGTEELARRSLSGAVIVPLCFFLVVAVSDFYQQRPALMLVFSLIFLSTGIARGLAVRMLLQNGDCSLGLWRGVLCWSCLLMASAWGSASAVFILAYGESYHGMLILIISAGMGSAAVANFCIWRRLASCYIALLFIPNFICCLWMNPLEIMPILLAMTFFVAYMILQVRRWNSEYWNSLLTAFQFEEQADKLSIMNDQLILKMDEQRAYQAELEVSRKKMRDIFDFSHDAILICDLGGRILDLNETMVRMFASAKIQAMRHSLLELLSTGQGVPESLQTIWSRAIGGDEVDAEWLMPGREKGGMLFLQINLRKVVWHEQHIVFVTIRDITSRKMAEDERDLARSSLAKSEGYLQAILKNINMPIYCKDLAGRYLSSNEQFERLADTSGENIKGKTDEEIFGQEIAPHFSRHDEEVSGTGKSLGYESNLGGMGEGATLLVHKFCLKDSDDAVYATGGIYTDISIIKKAYDAEKRANEAKSEFLANMSHELRTPMHSILSFARLGLKKMDSSPREKIESCFRMIMLSGEQLLELLTDLLDLSSLESKKMNYRMGCRNIIPDLGDVLREFQAVVEEKRIDLVFDSPFSAVLVHCDRMRMCQVVRNLLANAIKFTGAEKRIRVTVRDEMRILDGTAQPVVKIQVEDQGLGIPVEERDLVFEKFVQSSTTKTGAGGAGLGLAICRQIIEDHLGKIWAEGNSAGGSTLCFFLPVVSFAEGV